MNAASGEHKNRARWPISSTFPQRPIGILSRKKAFFSGSAIQPAFISVAKGPGLI